MARFDRLISLIEPLKNDTYGEMIIDREHKGTLDDPIHFPFNKHQNGIVVTLT